MKLSLSMDHPYARKVGRPWASWADISFSWRTSFVDLHAALGFRLFRNAP
jgi:hypothetical protein